MPQAFKWYDIKALAPAPDAAARSAEIYIYGNIGDKWDENGVIAADLVRELSAPDADTHNTAHQQLRRLVPDGLGLLTTH